MARFGSIEHFLKVMAMATHVHTEGLAFQKDHLKGYVRIEVLPEEEVHSLGIFYFTQDSFGRWSYEVWNDDNGGIFKEAQAIKFTMDDYRQIALPSDEVGNGSEN